MTDCYVYHICHADDKYDFSKGYIGISENPEYRWNRHKKYEKDGRLFRVYKKYSDIIEYKILVGSREYCLFIENKLRSNERIGWNLVKGGGDPPSHRNKIMTDSQKAKIGKSNSGSKNPFWIGWWVVDGIKFETTKEVSEKFNITRKTVRDRVKNSKFPNWRFEPKEREIDEHCTLSRLRY